MKKMIFFLITCVNLVSAISCTKKDTIETVTYVVDYSQASLKTNEVIYNEMAHSAFTDLIYYGGKFYLIFRAANYHAYNDNGSIIMMSSTDGIKWLQISKSDVENYDLRDPKFIRYASDKDGMEFTAGVLQFDSNKNPMSVGNLNVKFVDKNMLEKKEILKTNLNYWPWAYAKYQNYSYSFAYNQTTNYFSLIKTTDFLNYESVSDFSFIPGKLSEASIDIKQDKIYGIIRNAGPTYFITVNIHTPSDYDLVQFPILGLGGPNFIFYDENMVILAGRENTSGTGDFTANRTSIFAYHVTKKVLTKICELPTSGDTGYPGMVLRGKNLYMSYYNYENNKAVVKMAKIQLLLK